MSVWTDVRDEAGLVATCHEGRRLGLLGRAAVHPRQVRPIQDAFAPTPDEIARARAVVAALPEAEAVGIDASGRMIDPAVVRTARTVLSLMPSDDEKPS